MRRVVLGLLIGVAFVLGSASVTASGISGLRMSLVPGGAAVTDFPSGVEEVYVVFEYTDLMSEPVRVVVTDHAGQVLFENTQTYTGSGTASVVVRLASGPFPDGPYVTTLYFAGDYLSQAVEWTVGGVNTPPTPTPYPEARLEVQPALLTFRVAQGAEDPPAQRVWVTNHTVPASVWRADPDVSWLRLSQDIGLTPALLRIGVRGRGLPGALYEGHVSVSAAGVIGSPQTVTVTLAITAPWGSVTQALAADPSETGWVAADASEPRLNVGEIRVGVQGDRTYLGAMRVDLSAIPTDAELLAAAVALKGLRWEVRESELAGGWTLELVDPAVAETWDRLDYATLATAPVLTTLAPVLTAGEMRPGVTQFWTFDPSGVAALGASLREAGVALFRLRGPTSAGGSGLFVWDAAGTLRVNFRPPAPPEATATSTPVATAAVTQTPVVTATFTPATATPTATIILTPAAPPLSPKPGGLTPAAAWSPELGGVVALGLVLGAVLWQRFGSTRD